MKLTSPAFTEGGKIPSKYTCDGQNINPPLQFSDVPKGAQALVLVMDDPDIPDFAKEKFNIEVWDHWVIFNIPADTREIPEGKMYKFIFFFFFFFFFPHFFCPSFSPPVQRKICSGIE